MTSLSDWSLRFIRWGMGLTIVGLLTGYAPLGHYLMMGANPSCPAAPIHGHTILLSFLGMTVFGLVYRALPQWMGDAPPPLGSVRLHFWLSVIGVLGVCINGTIGYEALSVLVQEDFYYVGDPGANVRNLWFAIDGLFLTIYGAGCVIFAWVVIRKTRYGTAA